MSKKFYNYLSLLFLTGVMLSVLPKHVFAVNDGETFEYDIKKAGLNVGTTTFEFKGVTSIDAHPVVWIQVIAKGLGFYDEENIYLEESSYLPVVVKRNLDIFGKKETIVEKYNQEKGFVEILGRAEDQGHEKTTKIEVNHLIDNIYGFIYRYRIHGAFQEGEEIVLHLPTRNVTLKLEGEKFLKVTGKAVSTYYMEDAEGKIKVWFDTGKDKIPYRINGAIGFGNTSLIIKSDNNVNLGEDKGEK